MTEALELFLDQKADEAVREIWTRLADAGLPSLAVRSHRRHRPHISLAVAEALSQADLTDLLRVLGEERPELELNLLGTFPGDGGVLFLGVAPTASLLSLHSRAHVALAGQAIRFSPEYRPGGGWVPHCTLAEGLDRVAFTKALAMLRDYQPIRAQAASYGIVNTRTGDVTPLSDTT